MHAKKFKYNKYNGGDDELYIKVAQGCFCINPFSTFSVGMASFMRFADCGLSYEEIFILWSSLQQWLMKTKHGNFKNCQTEIHEMFTN